MKDSEGICRLVAYNGSLQIAHWLADTVTNEHKALGDLYEKMVGLTDEFAEVYMGKNGLIGFPKDAVITDITKSPAVAGLELVEELQEQFEAGEDDDLLAQGGCLAAQLEGVTQEVGRQLDLLDLIVVRQDDGVPLPLQLEYLSQQISGSVHGVSEDCNRFSPGGQIAGPGRTHGGQSGRLFQKPAYEKDVFIV